MIKYLGLLLFGVMQLTALGYDKPNSVAYDPIKHDYFITNNAGKTVTKLDSNFGTSEVIKGLKSPKDLLFLTFGPYKGLIVLDSNAVKVYDADSYSLIASFNVSGAIDLEDGEADKKNSNIFYITDAKAHKVFKVVIGSAPFYTPTFSVLCNSLRNPKAMLYDARGRLLVTTDTLGSEVYEINTSTGSASLIQTTTVNYINSIEEDLQGNYYATSWGDSYIYRFNADFKNAKGLFAYNKPTGMFFNKTYDVLVVACSNCNKVEFHKLHMVYINDADTAACPGLPFYTNINQQFKGIGTYMDGNVFYAELSDAKGGFKSPILIGKDSSVVEPVSMTLKLPTGIRFVAGDNYLIRIRSTYPAFTSINEAVTVLPYIPVANLNLADTLAFCNPSTLTIGSHSDPDSGKVNFVWSENGKVNGKTNSTFTKTYTQLTHIKLTKYSSNGKCAISDSIVLRPASDIPIPYKDFYSVCEGKILTLGGDSIPGTRIEWSSRNFPNVNTQFKPSYLIFKSDTFKVKVSSITGSCVSNKNVIVEVTPRPKFEIASGPFVTCAGQAVQLRAQFKTGIKSQIKIEWSPFDFLSNTNSETTNFRSSDSGDYFYRFTALDTVMGCSDTLVTRISNVAQPMEPQLDTNQAGVFIKNYNATWNYFWYKDGQYVAQPSKTDHCVLPSGATKYGKYYVVSDFTKGISCRDTSATIDLNKPLVGVNNVTAVGVNIFPNPATTEIYVNGAMEDFDYEVYDRAGKVLLSGHEVSNKAIKINTLASGMYQIRVNFEGHFTHHLFIKL